MEFPFGDFSEIPISRFESMLKTNEIQFFDASEFEEIGQYYIDAANLSMAKKAIEVGLNQHPDATELVLLLIEYHTLTNAYEEARILVDNLIAVEPFNPYAFQHLAVIQSKCNEHQKAIDSLKKGLMHADNKYEFHALLAMEYLYLDAFLWQKNISFDV